LEKVAFDIPSTAGGDKRPTYGHLRADGDYTGGGNQYGKVSLDLWPGSHHLTTTQGDSLDDYVEARDDYHGYTSRSKAPMSKNDAKEAIGLEDLTPEHKSDGYDYREIQVHGGPVQTKDVQRANIRRRNPWMGDMKTASPDRAGEDETAKHLRRAGIPVTMVDSRVYQPTLRLGKQFERWGDATTVQPEIQGGPHYKPSPEEPPSTDPAVTAKVRGILGKT
jgi:hypothetical protein